MAATRTKTFQQRLALREKIYLHYCSGQSQTAIAKALGLNHNGLPKLEVLLAAFGGESRQSALMNWARCVQTGVGIDVLARFTPLKESQIRHALGNINPSARVCGAGTRTVNLKPSNGGGIITAPPKIPVKVDAPPLRHFQSVERPHD